MRTTLTVYKASTYVRLTGYKPELMKQILRPFCKRNFFRFQKVPSGPFGAPPEWKVSHVFARFNNDQTELRFNASKLEELLNLMETSGYKRSRVEIIEEKIIPGEKVQIDLKNNKIKPRNELQEEFVEFMSGPARLCTNNMGTGQGKTFCALYSSYLIGERILITVLPRYIDIWIKAFGEFYDIKPKDLVVADLISVEQLHESVKSGHCNPKIIILPLSKIDIYLKRMREDETLPSLDQVFADLKCGTRIIDEAHESIYSVYQSLMHGNHQKTMALSATLKGDDEFVNGIYDQIFPQSSYLRPTEYTKYIHVIAFMHRMDLWKHKINTKGFGGYSHVKFEQGILKKKYLFEQYYQMLKSAYDMYYMDTYQEGQKSMWFFATIEFCDEFNKRLLKDYPGLDSIVFNSTMSKKQPEAYRQHRNVVTTPGSCGTGKDIPMLKAVFSPIAVSSTQRNDQMVGRTRPIDAWWPELDPYFVYFVCLDERKQVEYHRKRRVLFDRKMKKFDMIDSGFRIH